jgi:DUF1680 family protein
MELAFYNAVMTGMSCDGSKFTYTNQLASSDAELSQRADWFSCACCPPNVARLLGSIGGYIYDVQEDAKYKHVHIRIHMPTSCRFSCNLADGYTISFHMSTNYPWDGKVKFVLYEPIPGDKSITISIRVPEWAYSPKVSMPSLIPDTVTNESSTADRAARWR